MGRLIVLAVCALAFTTTAAGQNIGPDFKSSSYPWSGPPSWSERLEWLHISSSKTVRLTNGRWADPSQSEESANGTASFAGLTLESVTWADITGEGRDDAIVVIRYDTGGTQFSYFVYLYSMRAGRPHLLGCFHAGDRAYSGLYRVYAQNKELVVELFDPAKRTGDCCSSGFIRTRYRWKRDKCEVAGATEFGTPKATSRIPVSPFGLHQ
jgi:hypothetical protein